MKKEIRKLIEEYASRIKDCDILLENIRDRNREIRKKIGFSSSEEKKIKFLSDQENLKIERVREDAKRQAYVQFIANLKGVLGEI